MDSASDSGSEGWGFESLLACQKNSVFLFYKNTLFFYFPLQRAGKPSSLPQSTHQARSPGIEWQRFEIPL